MCVLRYINENIDSGYFDICKCSVSFDTIKQVLAITYICITMQRVKEYLI